MMELNWSTFLLEIINFLVLVWILKRFLYRPVLDVIARRRAGVEKTLADAAAQASTADELRERYEGRLADWDREKRQASVELSRELDELRKERLDRLNEDLAKERDNARLAEERRQAEESRRMEREALDIGAAFAARLLGALACPELESRLVAFALERLGDLKGGDAEPMVSGDASRIVVASAFRVPEAQRERLSDTVRKVLAPGAPVEFEIDESLVAGIRIVAGDRSIGFNLRDELGGFAAAARAG